jgi:hypothetical protein
VRDYCRCPRSSLLPSPGPTRASVNGNARAPRDRGLFLLAACQQPPRAFFSQRYVSRGPPVLLPEPRVWPQQFGLPTGREQPQRNGHMHAPVLQQLAWSSSSIELPVLFVWIRIPRSSRRTRFVWIFNLVLVLPSTTRLVIFILFYLP